MTKEQKQFVIDNYKTLGPKQCGIILNINKRKTQSFAKRIGLITGRFQNHVPYEQFLNIQTPEVAYILGLLWADGNLYKDQIRINCVAEDLEKLEWIFDKTGKWRKFYSKQLNCKDQLLIYTNNKPLRQFLEENDYIAKSTASADKILSKIPDHLKHYWFRGLVDGDGCFYINQENGNNMFQFTIASSYEQDWGFVENLLKTLNIKYVIQKNEQKRKNKSTTHSSKIRITSRYSINKLGNYLYQNIENDNIGLKRKYEKYLKVKVYCERNLV